VILPSESMNKRALADFSRNWCGPLAVLSASATVADVECDSPQEPSLTHLNHTPSPQGQYNTALFVLPHFFGFHQKGGATHALAPGVEPQLCSRVGFASKSRQGTATCPSRLFHLPSSPVQGLQPVATRLANKRWVARPSAQVLPRSPAAALPKVQPSVLRAMSPTANSTPADVTKTTFGVRGFEPRRPRSSHPARRLPLRGVCVSHKTQKDIPCSRKS